MKKTVFITGCSSGIGQAAAMYFSEQGWNVIATVRRAGTSPFPSHSSIHVVVADVTNKETMMQTIDDAFKQFGSVDVVVNNAGYGLLSPCEEASEEQIRRQVETNILGLVFTTQEFIKRFREQKQGVIINVASMMGRVSLPYLSLYTSTKWAVEGFTESLVYELEPLGIRVKIIEPGTIKTSFFTTSLDATEVQDSVYKARFAQFLSFLKAAGARGEEPLLAAKTIFKAATDGSKKLRYRVDKTAVLLLTLKRLVPFSVYKAIVKNRTRKS